MKIISGTSNPTLARAVAGYMRTKLTEVDIKRFKDQEVYVEVKENVRGQDVFVFQPTSKPANDSLMELLILIDAIKRGSASRITAVIPYYGYARQDRKVAPRSPISAKLVADLITTAGVDRVLMLDLHAGQIQGFFDVPVDNLTAAPVFAEHIETELQVDRKKTMIVSPDVGGVVRARQLAKMIECDIAIIDKRRPRAGVSEVMNVIGDVSDRDCVLVDDIVDSAGTLCNAAQALMDSGASSVRAYCTHGVLSEPALERITASPMDRLYITDSIEATPEVEAHDKITQITVATLIGEAMLRIRDHESVTELFRRDWMHSI